MKFSSESKMADIFRVLFELDDNSDVRSIRRITEKRWDSLTHVALVAAIENEFKVKLNRIEMNRLTSYAAANAMIAEKLT